jgi:hypothetical protein
MVVPKATQHFWRTKPDLTAIPEVLATVKHPVADRPCMNMDALAELFGTDELRCGRLSIARSLPNGITDDLP